MAILKICDYGCGQEAKYQFKNGKWCCSENYRSCPEMRKKNSISMKGKIPWNKGKNIGPFSKEHKKKISEENKGKHTGKTTGPFSEEHKKKISESKKLMLKDYKEKYPFFYNIEELRENKNGEIQGRCKNHNCKNSKENEGWFTLTSAQLNQRIQALEKPKGFGESNFYCSQHCKYTCILFRTRNDPLKENNLPYTYAEYLTCRAIVFERENTLCEYCGEPATDMHHIFPVKIAPFFALDPDYCVACCEKHHYKYAHKDECSTGNLAKIVCSVESQKFLNQKIGGLKWK